MYILIENSGQSYILETMSLSKMTSICKLEGVISSGKINLTDAD
uniref:Uncharacterized protein n=1 Tax=Arundo donax TaxID=35708 RepID=A0A0A9H3A6_ARUDO